MLPLFPRGAAASRTVLLSDSIYFSDVGPHRPGRSYTFSHTSNKGQRRLSSCEIFLPTRMGGDVATGAHRRVAVRRRTRPPGGRIPGRQP